MTKFSSYDGFYFKMKNAYFLERKIYYHDTDWGGVVYYANYLKYFEEARTEYLLQCGVDIKNLAEEGVIFVVRKVTVRYFKPAFYGDVVRIYADLTQIGKASLEFIQEVKKDDVLLVSASVSLGCVDSKSLSPKPIPSPIKMRLESSSWKK